MAQGWLEAAAVATAGADTAPVPRGGPCGAKGADDVPDDVSRGGWAANGEFGTGHRRRLAGGWQLVSSYGRMCMICFWIYVCVTWQCTLHSTLCTALPTLLYTTLTKCT